MAVSPVIYYNGDTASATVGTSQVVIPAANYANNVFLQNMAFDTGYGYFRIAYSTNSSVSTPSYGGTLSYLLFPIVNNEPLDQDFVITGLTPGTKYYWYPMYASSSGATYYEGLNIGTLTTYPNFTMSTASNPPTANFSVSTTTGPAQLAVDCTASTTGTPYAWAWLASNGTNSYTDNRQNPTLWLNNPGTYTVTLTVTNADGTDSEVKANLITVLSANPVPSWTQNVTSGVRPLTVTYTGTATSANTSYTPTSWAWALPTGIGTEYPTTRIATVTYNVAGTYSATLTATHWIGTGSTSSATAVTVYPLSVGATFTASPLTGSVPLSVQFIGTPSGDTASAVFNFGDGSTTTASNPSHLYTAASTYTPTYTVYGTTSPFAPLVATSTATGTSWITAESAATYKTIMEDIRRQLLLNTDVGTVCTDFLDWGGASIVLKHVYNRVCRLQLETGLLRKTSTTITATSAGVLDLPADLIEIRSIYVNGKRLEKVDARMADLADPSWVSATSGDYKGWYTNPSDHLKLHLVPPVTPSTFEVYYVYAPTEPTVPNDCATANWATLPLPFVYWWVIKYGVLSDLLQQEGDMYDIERAQQCEKLWQEGVEIIKLTLDGK